MVAKEPPGPGPDGDATRPHGEFDFASYHDETSPGDSTASTDQSAEPKTLSDFEFLREIPARRDGGGLRGAARGAGSTPTPARLALGSLIGENGRHRLWSEPMLRTRDQLPGARWTQRILNRSARRAASRDRLLELLPSGSVGAEVGVFRGDFSERILAIVGPRKLHLIDPWTMMTDEHPKDGLPVSADYADPRKFEQRYEQVRARFSGEIASGRVVIHRASSTEAAPGFAEGYFDWVYIDGNHHYEFVLSDLEAYLTRIKPGGRLGGDDYGRRGRCDNGVERAVREFLGRNPNLEPVWLGPAHQFLLLKP